MSRFGAKKRLTLVVKGADRRLWQGGRFRVVVRDLLGQRILHDEEHSGPRTRLCIELRLDAAQRDDLHVSHRDHRPAWYVLSRRNFLARNQRNERDELILQPILVPDRAKSYDLSGGFGDDFSVAIPRKYRDVARRSHRVAVLASRGDTVLKWAYPPGDLLQRFIFFWKEDFGLALGYHGPRRRGIHPVPEEVHHEQIPDSRQAGHGDYIAGRKPANPEQYSTTCFVNQVFGGMADPAYPPVTSPVPSPSSRASGRRARQSGRPSGSVGVAPTR